MKRQPRGGLYSAHAGRPMGHDVVAFEIDHEVLLLGRPGALPHHFLSPGLALRVLPRLSAEPSKMARLRGYLAQLRSPLAVINLSDHDVLRILGGAIENGQLQATVLPRVPLKTILAWIKSGMSRNDAVDRGNIFTRLLKTYPTLDADLLGYVLSIRPQRNYLTEKQIAETMSTIDRINSKGEPGQEETVLAEAIAELRRANIPGTDKLIFDLFNGNSSATDYLGSRFQLRWINDHQDKVAKIEDFRPGGAKGVDVLMKDGNFIDTKSYKDISLRSLMKQIDTYKRDFPNLQHHTLEFVLERGQWLKTSQRKAQELSKEINDYAITLGFNAKITIYPP